MSLLKSSARVHNERVHGEDDLMRVTTDFFAAALLRQLRGVGAFAYLVRRGAHEAGSLFILHHRHDGGVDLYGPAPQSLYHDENMADQRLFIRLACGENSHEAQARLEKELDFDPDLWIGLGTIYTFGRAFSEKWEPVFGQKTRVENTRTRVVR